MKSSLAFSLLFLLPSIRAAALPQLFGDELESTASSQKRDDSGNIALRSPESGFLNRDSMDAYLAEAGASTADDPSLDNSLNLKQDLSARSPQGPTSNPGEFTDAGLSRANSAHHESSKDSSSSFSADNGQGSDHNLDDDFLKMSEDVPPGMDLMMEDDPKMGYHRHHNGSHHNGTHHHGWNGTHPAWNATDHHHHHHNHTWGSMPTATGTWFPTGTAWMPSGKGMPRHHRKVPSAAYAGFRGPKSKRDGSFSKNDEYSAGGI